MDELDKDIDFYNMYALDRCSICMEITLVMKS